MADFSGYTWVVVLGTIVCFISAFGMGGLPFLAVDI